MGYENNELTFKEILSKSFEIFLKRIKPIIFVSLLAYLPVSIFVSFLAASQFTEYDNTSPYNIYYVIQVAIESLLNPLAVSGISFVTYKHFSNEDVKISNVLEKIFDKWKDLLIATLIYAVIVLIFSALSLTIIFSIFFIPMLLFSLIAFTYYKQAIVLGNKKGLESLMYSAIIAASSMKKTAVFVLISVIAKELIIYIFSILLIALNLTSVAVTMGVLLVIYIIFSIADIAQTILYMNLEWKQTNS